MRAEPLGSLLASRGHITPEQLELALTEQKATGRPLGEIIVARGFAPGPTVAQALATQHGGLLKTEYGFATGWGGQENSQARVPAPEPPRHDETATLRASLEEHQKALEAWKQAHAQLEERLAQANAAEGAPANDPRVGELEAERDALKAEREALKAELAEAQKPAEPVSDPRVAELEAERDVLKGEREAAARELESAHQRASTLEAELAARDAAKEELPVTPAGRWDTAESHLVFFQGVDGYELHERSGPPPSEGSSVGAQIVARIASAPIPGSALPCAYLVS
jgi:hypothetical protein